MPSSKSRVTGEGEKLAQLRAVIKKTDPAVVEEVKWKKPSKPSGVPVWSHDGNICIADTLKNAVRLTFPKGAQMKDPQKLFNTRLDSKTVRAIDFHEGDLVDESDAEGTHSRSREIEHVERAQAIKWISVNHVSRGNTRKQGCGRTPAPLFSGFSSLKLAKKSKENSCQRNISRFEALAKTI